MKLIISILVVLAISGCFNSGKIKSCDSIQKIVIINKTINRNLPNVTTLKEAEIKEFCILLSKISPHPGNLNLRNQYGFYDFFILEKGDKEVELNVIFTKYDGVIIWYDGYYYKQDEFEEFVNRIVGPIFHSS